MKGFSLRFSFNAFTGQAATQRPQPMHLLKSIDGREFFFPMVIALAGQILMHSGQVPWQRSIRSSEWKLDLSEGCGEPASRGLNALQQQVQQGLSVTRAGASRGYSRTVASHLLRLLRLEPTVQQWVAEHQLSVGHAKMLVGLEPKRQLHLARRIGRERLSVRQVESLMGQIRRDPRDPATIPFDADPRGPDHVRFEARLSEQLGVPVTVEYARDGAGRLILAFSDLEILDGLLERLGYCDDAD